MDSITSIGIDLGATNIRGAIANSDNLLNVVSRRINTNGTEQQVLNDVFAVIDNIIDDNVSSIGIGVPSVVDVEQGIVYDVQNIPSWKEVYLKQLLEGRYKIPVYVNNDANCFAIGEHYFGHGNNAKNMVGLTIGTGLGSGIIINKKLYAGPNCGAGEFGMVDYLDHNYEYYCSGSFFSNVYNISGEDVFERAKRGDANALKLYEELGLHLGNAIKLIMYTYDPDLIVFGGSVAKAFEYFQAAMWKQIKTLAYTKSIEKLKIETSVLQNSGILGAAALCRDDDQFQNYKLKLVG